MLGGVEAHAGPDGAGVGVPLPPAFGAGTGGALVTDAPNTLTKPWPLENVFCDQVEGLESTTL